MNRMLINVVMLYSLSYFVFEWIVLLFIAIFTVINDITQLASERYQNGGSKEAAKGNIVTYIFELLDARMSAIANPSLKTFFII